MNLRADLVFVCLLLISITFSIPVKLVINFLINIFYP